MCQRRRADLNFRSDDRPLEQEPPIKALRLLEPASLAWEEVTDPSISGRGQVLVETSHATVCGTDLHKVFAGTSRQPYPARPGFPGHEAVGRVVDSTSNAVTVGQQVLVVPDMSHAAAFAERQVLPERFIVALPEGSDPEVLILSQQLGTVLWALERFWPASRSAEGRFAVVLGSGPAGLFFVDRLRARGFAGIVVSDRHSPRLERARTLGATTTVLVPDGDVVETVLAHTGGAGADLVVEAAGEDDARNTSVEAVRVDGHVGWFGTPSSLDPVPFPIATFFQRKPTLVAQHHAQHEVGHRSFHQAIHLIEQGEVATDNVITHWFPPAQVLDALELARRPRDDSFKVGLRFREQFEITTDAVTRTARQPRLRGPSGPDRVL